MGSATASPHPTTTPASSPQKSGVSWRLREDQAAASPRTRRDSTDCSKEQRCQIPCTGLFKQFKTCSRSAEAALEHHPLPGRGAPPPRAANK
ncbi:hypothetical protein Q9966_006940 [Columba livia]|nr:hypothetical protein Q9966_006940 [Columba livia]